MFFNISPAGNAEISSWTSKSRFWLRKLMNNLRSPEQFSRNLLKSFQVHWELWKRSTQQLMPTTAKLFFLSIRFSSGSKFANPMKMMRILASSFEIVSLTCGSSWRKPMNCGGTSRSGWRFKHFRWCRQVPGKLKMSEFVSHANNQVNESGNS